jgi:hypothetical protein
LLLHALIHYRIKNHYFSWFTLKAAAFLAFIINILEMRGAAWKLLVLHQRPVPVPLESIGTWQSIFLIIVVASLLTNASLTVFTMNVLNDYDQSTGGFWFFTLFQVYRLSVIIWVVMPYIHISLLIFNIVDRRVPAVLYR